MFVSGKHSMKTLYFDCFSGAAGDMLAGALIDAGADFNELKRQLDQLGLSGFEVRADKLKKQGFAATKFDVIVDPDTPQPHRHLSDIRTIVEKSQLPDAVKKRVLAVFERLADAEAQAHGTTPEKVHFHEVGAIDSIVDITAVTLALDMLGAERIVCSPLPTGNGTVLCDHGVMPVPAPATLNLLKGVPIAECDEQSELLTPTAAALLTTVCDEFGPLPSITLETVGVGAGTRDNKTRPNVVRALLGSSTETHAQDTVAVLETNLDDCPGEWIGHCVNRLIDQGALDAYCAPIYMKKSRPGMVLSVICDPSRVTEFEKIIFAETSTFGIRRHLAQRSKLDRRCETVETVFGSVRMKIGERQGEKVTCTAEYEDCAEAAANHDVPLRRVMEEARKQWNK